MKTNEGELRGVLHLNAGKDKYRLRRYFPSDALKPLVEQYWLVSWALAQGETHHQQNLPDPNMHLVIEKNHCYVQSVVSKKFTYTMRGHGQIIGVKFALGSLKPLLSEPMSKLINQQLLPETLFGDQVSILLASLKDKNDEQIVARLESFLTPFIPAADPSLEPLNRLISTIKTESGITKVEQLVPLAHMTMRSIQRLFNTYIGLSPKWVIRKYRLHQALQALEDNSCDIQDIVERLDYSDQAHLIRDFKDMLGLTPGRYKTIEYPSHD